LIFTLLLLILEPLILHSTFSKVVPFSFLYDRNQGLWFTLLLNVFLMLCAFISHVHYPDSILVSKAWISRHQSSNESIHRLSRIISPYQLGHVLGHCILNYVIPNVFIISVSFGVAWEITEVMFGMIFKSTTFWSSAKQTRCPINLSDIGYNTTGDVIGILLRLCAVWYWQVQPGKGFLRTEAILLSGLIWGCMCSLSMIYRYHLTEAKPIHR